MICRKGGYRTNEEFVKWKGKKIERVQKFNYLGYMLMENNKDEEHIGYMMTKANRIMGKVWGMAEW